VSRPDGSEAHAGESLTRNLAGPDGAGILQTKATPSPGNTRTGGSLLCGQPRLAVTVVDASR
jgi:hypothetical protein